MSSACGYSGASSGGSRGRGVVLLVKHNTLILYSYFHRMVMFISLFSKCDVLQMHRKKHSKSFLPYFLTFIEILLKSLRKVSGDIYL